MTTNPITAEEAKAKVQDCKPCPACPDGNEWGANGPTGRACRVCDGHAVLRIDGSKLTKGCNHE